MENTIQSDLIRGHINTIILKALYDGDRYGYDIVREIEQKSSGQYKLKQPTLYSCLKRLEIQGFIRSYWGAKSNGGRRKYFTLTDMGRELFIKNQSEWEYSRTVIDKLISDREVDLSRMAPLPDEEAEDEEQVQPEEEESVAPSPAEEYRRSQSEEETVPPEPAPAPEKAESAATEIAFTDTAAIMNELFRRKETEDESYAEKLITEKYVSDRTAEAPLSSDDYFKDFYESDLYEEPVATESNDPENARGEQERLYAEQMPSSYAYANQTPQSDYTPDPPFVPPQPPVAEPEQPARDNRFLDYHTSVVQHSDTAVIEREYRNILGDILNPAFVSPVTPAPEPPQPEYDTPESDYTEQNAYASEQSDPEYDDYDDTDMQSAESEDTNAPLQRYTGDADVNRKLNRLTGEVREMGDNVTIRTHNNESSKTYTNTYYYYSNKLMMVHYGILFGVMMLEILFSAVFVNLVLHDAGRGSRDKWFYIIAGIVAVIFPVVAFVKNFTAPNKRKRINFSLKNSLIYRSIVMAQCFLIIYCINVIAGMPVAFGKEYITTLLLPALLCTGFPVSALIFHALFKSKKFSVEQ